MEIHVLLADDSAPLQRLVRAALAPMSLRLTCLAEGRMVLELIHADPPDVVLLDIGLPGPPWPELVQEYNRVKRGGISLLLVSPLDDIEESRARREGATGVLLKPFEAATLREVLTEHFPDAWPAGRPFEEPPRDGAATSLGRIRRDVLSTLGGQGGATAPRVDVEQETLRAVEARVSALIGGPVLDARVAALIREVLHEELRRILPQIVREEVNRRIAEIEAEASPRGAGPRR